MASLGYMERPCLTKQIKQKPKASKLSPHGRMKILDGGKKRGGDVGNVDKAMRLEAHVHPGPKIRAQEPADSALIALTQINPGLLCSWLQPRHTEDSQSL